MCYLKHCLFRVLKLLPLLFLCYLIVGAVIPFIRYQQVSEETKNSFSLNDFYQESPGSDRVKLLETNKSALTERIRLLNQAKEQIIISTFDMRLGESTSDLLSVLYHKAEEGVQIQFLVDGFSSLTHIEGKDLFYAFSCHPNVEIRIYNPVNLFLPWKTQ